MHTLLMRLTGPMQSWGTQSRFSVRDTGMEPSKSGVIGLLCAALGRSRNEPVDDLAQLLMGVRVDHEGTMLRDFQTALDVIKASGAQSDNAVLSHRYYLADADFLVGLSGDSIDQLQLLDDALTNPHWQLSLGRKAFVPGVPVYLPRGGVRADMDLRTALQSEPWPSIERVRVVIETSTGNETRIDQPFGVSYSTRHFLPRTVTTEFWSSDRYVNALEPIS